VTLLQHGVVNDCAVSRSAGNRAWGLQEINIMPKYKIELHRSIQYDTEIEAESTKAAAEEAWRLWEQGSLKNGEVVWDTEDCEIRLPEGGAFCFNQTPKPVMEALMMQGNNQ
jgi:hypothetical protein